MASEGQSPQTDRAWGPGCREPKSVASEGKIETGSLRGFGCGERAGERH